MVRKQLSCLLKEWLPNFHNMNKLYMRFGGKWQLVPFNDLKELSKEEAWADMPIEAIKYVKSLKEFDASIFTKITGIK